ncbi:MAG TPA: methyltransferase domain-containing protein [Kofleriaceae bacterium]|nr:methyltransferase domain-containing protein [Kofleriaceae bacterium]
MREILDRWLYRHPFEGASARRYARDERPAFGDLDERLIARWARELAGARRFLDCGAGPGTFAARLASAHPHLSIVRAEPSRALATRGAVRAIAEALPFDRGAFDLALCLSSIRHVRDRARSLAELRRVARVLWIVELDPSADAARCANHAAHLGSFFLRAAFRPLVVRTAPACDEIASLARGAGWITDEPIADPIQPVYLLRCS